MQSSFITLILYDQKSIRDVSFGGRDGTRTRTLSNQQQIFLLLHVTMAAFCVVVWIISSPYLNDLGGWFMISTPLFLELFQKKLSSSLSNIKIGFSSNQPSSTQKFPVYALKYISLQCLPFHHSPTSNQEYQIPFIEKRISVPSL